MAPLLVRGVGTLLGEDGLEHGDDGRMLLRADMRQRVKASWLAAAEKSLATNRSTLAVLSMSELTSPDGMLAALRTKGYQVDEPE